MFDIGGGELLLIILAIIILFGPEKIPEVSKFISKSLQKIRQAQIQIQREINTISAEIEDSLKNEQVKKPTNTSEKN